MKTIYIIFLTATLTALLFGCSEGNPENRPTGDVIELTSGGGVFDAAGSARAVGSDFPNAEQIAVIAAPWPGEDQPVDWTVYRDIQHATASVMATGGNPANPTYAFQWDEGKLKYWPFNGDSLLFMAYSPKADDGSQDMYLPSTDNRYLLITLKDNMPDILYASANVDTTHTAARNKANPVVNLGEFRHALSKLTVQVVAEPGSEDPDIMVTKLEVSTTYVTANLDLTKGDDGLYLDDNEFSEYKTFSLVSTPTSFDVTPIRDSVLLYPGTEDVTMIHIQLNKGIEYLEKTYMMSYFTNAANPSVPLSLQRGKNTVLRIHVKTFNVNQPNDATILKGQIKGWNDGGNFSTVIE